MIMRDTYRRAVAPRHRAVRLRGSAGEAPDDAVVQVRQQVGR